MQATGAVTKTNWRLNLQPQAVDTQQLAKIGKLDLAPNYRGKLGGNIQVAGLNKDLVIERIQAQGQLNLQLPAGQIIADRIKIDRGTWQANLSSSALDSQLLNNGTTGASLIPETVNKSQLPPGIVSGSFQVSGNSLTKISPQTIAAQGRGSVKFKAGEIQSQNLTLTNGDWQGIFTTKNLQLAAFNPQIGGRLSGKANLAGNLKSYTPESIRGTGSGTIDLPQGQVVGTNLQIDRGKWQGNFQSSASSLA